MNLKLNSCIDVYSLILPQGTNMKCRQGTFAIGLNITIFLWALRQFKAREEIVEDPPNVFLELIQIAPTVFLDS